MHRAVHTLVEMEVMECCLSRGHPFAFSAISRMSSKDRKSPRAGFVRYQLASSHGSASIGTEKRNVLNFGSSISPRSTFWP